MSTKRITGQVIAANKEDEIVEVILGNKTTKVKISPETPDWFFVDDAEFLASISQDAFARCSSGLVWADLIDPEFVTWESQILDMAGQDFSVEMEMIKTT